ncbi:MAG: FAD-dependent oxidoreductase [Candidatus Hinthialibacter antarcticus]|nr:FAD-dependent oxidoreductase [Candidatus Hinthialibacter antarcticus]
MLKLLKSFALVLLSAFMSFPAFSATAKMYDVVVYGGTAGGAIAAVAAAREGLDAALIEPYDHIGGLTSGGLGRTDVGDSSVIGGYSREFYQRLGKHYGEDASWRFEPGVAERTLKEMLDEAKVDVFYQKRLASVGKDGNRITSIKTEDGSIFIASIFMDATYEGDLMAQAGVSYAWGREGRDQYGESLAGRAEHTHYHQFDVDVSPYADDGSVIPLVGTHDPGEIGGADKMVQAYNLRLCFSSDPNNRLPYPKPPNYDPWTYELLRRYLKAKPDAKIDELFIWSLMPNNKTDINNKGPVSTDYIGMNWDYPEADYARREEIYLDHLHYTQGLFYFYSTHPDVPKHIQEWINNWGPAKDEFTDNGGWPHQMYVREARRMISDHVHSQHDCQENLTKKDSVGMGSYNMDSHNVQRFINDRGFAENEGDVEVGPKGPYEIAYRCIRPKEAECANLLVPVCLSSSHMAFGSIRMEPVFMVLGHSAGVAAKMAIENGVSVQQIDTEALLKTLREQGQVLSNADRIKKNAVRGNP